MLRPLSALFALAALVSLAAADPPHPRLIDFNPWAWLPANRNRSPSIMDYFFPPSRTPKQSMFDPPADRTPPQTTVTTPEPTTLEERSTTLRKATTKTKSTAPAIHSTATIPPKTKKVTHKTNAADTTLEFKTQTTKIESPVPTKDATIPSTYRPTKHYTIRPVVRTTETPTVQDTETTLNMDSDSTETVSEYDTSGTTAEGPKDTAPTLSTESESRDTDPGTSTIAVESSTQPETTVADAADSREGYLPLRDKPPQTHVKINDQTKKETLMDFSLFDSDIIVIQDPKDLENDNLPLEKENVPPAVAHFKSASGPSSQCRILENLLKESLDSASLLAFKGQCLVGDSARNLLAAVIAKAILSENKDSTITGAIYYKWANHIKELFPGERSTTYYIPACTTANGIVLQARGKLVHQVLNKRRRLQNLGALPKGKGKRNREDSPTCSSIPSPRPLPGLFSCGEENEENVDDDIQWLENSSDPWHLVEEKWERTLKARTRTLYNAGKESIESYFEKYPALKKPQGYSLTVPLPAGSTSVLAKPTKYHYYPHNQHIYLLPECAIQQVCNAVYVRLNYTQPLCACPARYRDPCSASLNADDLHTTRLTTDSKKKYANKAVTLVKTCEAVSEMRECRAPRDWSLLALQNIRTGKSHYLVICRCPENHILEGPMSHDQPTYASVPGIRVYGMMCVRHNPVYQGFTANRFTGVQSTTSAYKVDYSQPHAYPDKPVYNRYQSPSFLAPTYYNRRSRVARVRRMAPEYPPFPWYKVRELARSLHWID